MNTCTFFGHRDTPSAVLPHLRQVLTDFIKNKNVTSFYVGNQGQFDNFVRCTLAELKKQNPYINYAVVLAYLPQEKEISTLDATDTIFPEGLENTPPRFAINKRNEWMLQNSDYVVCYVAHITGGAAKFTEKAKKKGKQVINLAELI